MILPPKAKCLYTEIVRGTPSRNVLAKADGESNNSDDISTNVAVKHSDSVPQKKAGKKQTLLSNNIKPRLYLQKIQI